MVALCNRATIKIYIIFIYHYIYLSLYFCPVISFYLSSSSSFFSLPNLSGRRLDVYHTSTHGVALVRI